MHSDPKKRECHSLAAQLVTLMFILLASGCASSVLDSYHHEQSVQCRIDNPDRDNLWDTSDRNGNGLIDEGETIGPVFDFASLAGQYSGDEISVSSTPARRSNSRSWWGATVSFITPPGYLAGIKGTQGQTVPQPITPGFQEDLVGGVSVAGDGIVDNLDGDSTSGFFFILDDIDGNGTLEIIADGVDFDDLHTFNIAFDRVLAAPRTEAQGMHVSHQHRITSKAEVPEESSPQIFELSYGARYLRLEERFQFDATGGVLGRTYMDMRYNNRLLGPQVSLDWRTNYAGWDCRVGSMLMLGYNFAEASQHATVGQPFAPGAINRPSSAEPDVIASARRHEEFASIAEVGASGSYTLRRNMALTLGYRALYMSELRHAGESIDWNLPSFGILDSAGNDAWLEGLHASIEWRR